MHNKNTNLDSIKLLNTNNPKLIQLHNKTIEISLSQSSNSKSLINLNNNNEIFSIGKTPPANIIVSQKILNMTSSNIDVVSKVLICLKIL